MVDAHVKAAFYLSPTLDALWRWSPDGDVLTWADDTTIAFAGEVEAVLRRLAPGGLPPFGAVALLLAACRDGWAESKGRATVAGFGEAYDAIRTSVAGTASGTTGGGAAGGGLVFRRIARDIERLLAGLDTVSRLPRELRTSQAGKAALAETVFEAHRRLGPAADAALIIRAFDEGLTAETLRPQLSHEERLSQFAAQVDGLDQGLARVDPEALARRVRTGLDDEVVAPADDLSPPERVRLLLASMRGDPDAETAGLARLAHELMAAVGVPRPLRSHDELPVGGVSDLSNRGPLDRLLVSELAHDDLTLAVRLAMNEALYLRRESPPREPPHRRAILIDAGIRLWGTPRLFATAAALALAATNDPKAILAVYRATPDGVEPVDLTTRDGVAAHLAALEAVPHPGASLRRFVDELAGGPGDDTATDAVVITHADAAADPDFVDAVRALPDPSLYVATIARDGAFELTAVGRTGRTLLRAARLSLDQILGGAERATPRYKREQAGVPLIAANRDPSLPAALLADPFPFMLPHVADPKLTASSPTHGLVAATADGQVLQWRGPDRGGRLLTALLPRGTVRLVTVDEDSGVATVVINHKQSTLLRLVHCDLASGRCTLAEGTLHAGGGVGAFRHAGVLFLIYRKGVAAVGLRDGEHLAAVELPPGWSWHHSRFFRDARGRTHVISYDASTTLRFDVLSGNGAFFDRAGDDAPWALRDDGTIVDGDGVTRFTATGPPGWDGFAASADGSRLAYRAGAKTYVTELSPGFVPRASDASADWLAGPQLGWSTRSSVQPQKNFAGVFVDAGGTLALHSAHGYVHRIHLERGALAFEGVRRGSGHRSLAQPFGATRRPPGTMLRMRVARWADGSTAWLDVRGLLHLKSSDASVPELTLTLGNRPPAAWASTGKVCGPEYFVGDSPQTEPAYFADVIRQFVMRIR